ncbi:MAG: adenylosuccinate lyase [Nitrososphaera sp.]|uniref:adenylosuccinate lyase n=1 Tax=Nitrososphaera sp. TaxID=1971748 RepID=UPI00182BDF15|nr:adenylosuccinate lyase [Nitrososphaera sp.]NWG37455.1 adenylosuccinate lyase [Nitrososphaera sp.]
MPILPIDSGRYGSKEMRDIFGDKRRLQYQLDFEAAAARAQAKIGMIPEGAARQISAAARSGKVTLARVAKLEAASEHDTAAMVEALSEQVSASAKPWVHYGLTSNDVVDTSTSMQMRDAFSIIEEKVAKIAILLSQKATKYRSLPAVGRTHGQHASIIAFGLKFAVWAAEMARHVERIEQGKKRFLACKTRGVVGTGSLMGNRALDVERLVASSLGLYPVDAATQVVPRERYAEMQFVMALVGSTLDKIAVEIRNLQRTEIAEVAEPFKKGQMGSSAVPVKRNPIKSERTSSLAKMLKSLVSVSMDNISLWHERDLSNSANERFTLPMAAILLDEMLNAMTKVVAELKVDEKRVAANLDMTRGQIFAEFVLEALVKKGVPRFEAYRDIQRVAFAALESGEQFSDAVSKDGNIAKHLTRKEVADIFRPKSHLAASEKIIESVARLVKEKCRR